MDRTPASRTARFVALYRALETTERRRKPLFADPLAVRFLTPRMRALVAAARVPGVLRALTWYADRRAPGARTSAIARTAYIDDVVRREVARGTRQVVLLGAGFDCRAHRLPELAAARVFEVDRGPTQAAKRQRVPASTVTYVSVDFLRDDTFAELGRAGWERGAPSVFVWEGVTNYLTEEAVRRVLAEMGRCAPGTTVVFTYVHKGALDGSNAFPGADAMRRNVGALGEPWTFGIDPAGLPSLLGVEGLRLVEDTGADSYRARYLGAAAPGYAFYRVAIARKP